MKNGNQRIRDITGKDLDESIGAELRNIRESCGYTQNEVANALSLKYHYYVGLLENGHRSITLALLIQFLNYYDQDADMFCEVIGHPELKDLFKE